jgi:hypothetical protein
VDHVPGTKIKGESKGGREGRYTINIFWIEELFCALRSQDVAVLSERSLGE